MVFLHLRKFIQTNCFINILLYNKLSRLTTKFTVFTLAPFERASFTPNKFPFLVDSIKLSFYCKNKKTSNDLISINLNVYFLNTWNLFMKLFQ